MHCAPSPVQIGTATNWQEVAAGHSNTIALKSDGTLWAWGSNSDGQLGRGSSDSLTTNNVPVQIGTVTTWTGIVAGAYHTLAKRADGTLWAWGDNSNGQVGNGSTTDVTSPFQLGAATNWNVITASFYASAATRSDGTLWTWGRNFEGQLGDGTLVQRSSPGQLGTGTNWQSVQGGYFHFLATKTDGSLWSWGYESERPARPRRQRPDRPRQRPSAGRYRHELGAPIPGL